MYQRVACHKGELLDPDHRAAIASFERKLKQTAVARARASAERRRAAEQARALAARELAATLRAPLTQ